MAAGTWEPYVSPGEGTVVGDLRIVRALEGPQLGRAVDVLAWLPPSYASSPARAYGVLYLWDAQNLFDHATSLSGEWQVDETMTRLAAEGLEWVVIGLAHGDGARSDEYAPWSTSFGVDGRGDATLALLCEAVKPLVERSFRTLSGPTTTAIGGSSLGGLMSLYALFARPDLFGRALVMSPAFFFTEGRIFDWVAGRHAPDARIWMDLGTVEAPHDEELERAYRDGFDRMRALLEAKGFGEDRLRTLLVDGAIHHESAWAERLPDALRFLLR